MGDNRNYEDPLGFTKQTGLLLTGLGGENIIDEIKKRNISTDELSKLSKEDLIVLGVEENEVDNLQKALHKLSKRSVEPMWIIEHKLKHLIEVLRDGQRQLSLIESYLTIFRIKLTNNRNKEIDNNANDSKALYLASTSVLEEFNFMKNEFHALKKDIVKKDQRKGSYVRLCVLISTLGLTGSIIFFVYKR